MCRYLYRARAEPSAVRFSETCSVTSAFVIDGILPAWSEAMCDPREYDGGDSDDEQALPDEDDDGLQSSDENGDPVIDDELPLNDGDEAIEDEDDA